MTLGGWIVMTFAVAGMSGLLAWCFWKIFHTPGSSEHLHSPVDIEPDDVSPPPPSS